jgi:hypothetical protein
LDKVRLHLIPALGRKRLAKPTVADLDRLWKAKLDAGYSSNSVRIMRTVLRRALGPRVVLSSRRPACPRGGTLPRSGRPQMSGLPHSERETGASVTDDTAISYQAAARGTPVLSSAGTQIGTLEHVLEVPEVDVFDGIVIATKAGLRFIDADYVQRITRSRIWCSIDDTQAAQLPPPEGAPVYRVDALQDSGHSLHDVLGRLFRRPRWTREDDPS